MVNEIIVGIPTDGFPQTERQGDLTLLRNMLIGKDFHWQKHIEVLLPGIVETHPEKEYSVVNRLPLEQYLECVVGSEMNPRAPVEFLKAHAVISRSWALGKIIGAHNHSEEGKENTENNIVNWEDTCDHHGFHVCSDDHCQRYQGLQPLHDKVRNALKTTVGEVLKTSDDHLVDARFSKCCGGRTELFSTCWQPREEPCLESFADPWCDLSSLGSGLRRRVLKSILKDYDLINGGGFNWSVTVTSEEVQNNLKRKFGRDIGPITGLKIISRGASGRVMNLLVTGVKGEIRIGKELMIRRLLSPTHLYSSWFDIQPLRKESINSHVSPIFSLSSNGQPEKNDISFAWRLTGHGWGHGVGLCQIGAARMALEGANYRDILSFYYPGSLIAII